MASGVLLTDEAQPAGAVQVVEAPVGVKVSAVFVSGTETVTGPAVGLPRFPPSGEERHRNGRRNVFSYSKN